MKRLISLAFVAVVFLSGCATAARAGNAATLKSAEAYGALGIERGNVALREDGMRTTGAPGTYEWWYFDSTLADGSTLVIVFYTKSMVKPDTPLLPQVSLELTRPDGTKVHRFAQFSAKDFSASKESCDVRIGKNSFAGNLRSYSIHVALEDVTADIRLDGDVPSWRPETGVVSFARGGEHYFAWLPSVPHGSVSGSVTIAGKTEAVRGSGYHDHNWGDVSMLSLIHDWYWGRAQVGPYSVIASYITAADAYGRDAIPIFMLAKDGQIIADDSAKIRFSAEDVHVNAATGKPVANRLVYEFDDGALRYRVTFARKAEIQEMRMIDILDGFARALAGLAGFDGAYLRFTGSVTVEKIEAEKVVDSATENSAVWELMYFGKAPSKPSAR